MAVSFRPVLTSGLVAASASAVLFSAVVTPTPEAPVARIAPMVSCAHVQLAAAVKPMPPGIATLTPAQVLSVHQTLRTAAVTPNLITTPGLINLATAIDNAYNAIEPWVRYAFDLVAYAVSWVPYIGWIIDDQIHVVYNFVEALVNSGVFNVTDWMRGEGSFAKNLADWVADLGLSLVWLAIDEAGAWVPLPPINYPPRAPYFNLPEGLFGDVLVDLSAAVARISNGIWNVWEPIKNGITTGVEWVSGVLDQISRVPFVPLINFELTEGWKLIATGGDQLTGFAHDMINAGNQFVHDTVRGGGLITATVNALNTTVASIKKRLSASAKAFADWGRAQVDFVVDRLTPGAARVPAVTKAKADVAEAPVKTAKAPTPVKPDDDTPAAETPKAQTSDKAEQPAPKKVRKPWHRTPKVKKAAAPVIDKVDPDSEVASGSAETPTKADEPAPKKLRKPWQRTPKV